MAAGPPLTFASSVRRGKSLQFVNLLLKNCVQVIASIIMSVVLEIALEIVVLEVVLEIDLKTKTDLEIISTCILKNCCANRCGEIILSIVRELLLTAILIITAA